MSEDSCGGMTEQLLAAGQRAIRHHLEGDTEMEHEALEFMDALWDRMSNDEREKSLTKLHASGLTEFADRIAKERRDLTGNGSD